MKSSSHGNPKAFPLGDDFSGISFFWEPGRWTKPGNYHKGMRRDKYINAKFSWNEEITSLVRFWASIAFCSWLAVCHWSFELPKMAHILSFSAGEWFDCSKILNITFKLSIQLGNAVLRVELSICEIMGAYTSHSDVTTGDRSHSQSRKATIRKREKYWRGTLRTPHREVVLSC